LFTLDTNGNATFNGNVKGSSIGSSSTPIIGSTGTFSGNVNGGSIGSLSTPITGSTLTLSATNITSLILPFPTTSYTHGIRMGNYIPGNTAGIAISAPSQQSFWPFAYFLPTSDINGAMHIGIDGSIYSAGNVNGSSIGSSSTPIIGSTGIFSGVVNLSGGTLNKIAYGRFDASGNLQAGSSNINGNANHTPKTGIYTVYIANHTSNYQVCVASLENYIGYAEVYTSDFGTEEVFTFSSVGTLIDASFNIICFMN
jgi:hypothetical protein